MSNSSKEQEPLEDRAPIEEIERLAQIFAALSNPNRLRIFLRCVSCCLPGTKCTADTEQQLTAGVGELCRDLALPPSTVSRHVKELRRAGLIHMQRRGQKVDCWVDFEVQRELSEFFAQPLSPAAVTAAASSLPSRARVASA